MPHILTKKAKGITIYGFTTSTILPKKGINTRPKTTEIIITFEYIILASSTVSIFVPTKLVINSNQNVLNSTIYSYVIMLPIKRRPIVLFYLVKRQSSLVRN